MMKTLLRAPFVWRAKRRDRRLAKDAHEVAIVAIFREEAPFLDEWIRFHESVGVGHFYLYNNFSTDDFKKVLQPYISRGLVTLHDWPIEVGQLPAYRHCIKSYWRKAKWMAFIDVDEFLFSPDGMQLGDVLGPLQQYPGVMVHSPYFGSAGIQKRPDTPITRHFTQRAPLSLLSAKTIANPRWVYAIRNVHRFKYWANDPVTADGELFDAANPRLETLRLNHYWSRSLDDLKDKISRGDASSAEKRDFDGHFRFEKTLNEETDTSILSALIKAFSAEEKSRH